MSNEKVDIIMDQKQDPIIFSVEKLPGTDPDVCYFIVDQSTGLCLIDAIKDKKYELSSELSFSPCRTLAVALLDPTGKDASMGIRVLKIDQKVSTQPEIKVYDFDDEFLDNLN